MSATSRDYRLVVRKWVSPRIASGRRGPWNSALLCCCSQIGSTPDEHRAKICKVRQDRALAARAPPCKRNLPRRSRGRFLLTRAAQDIHDPVIALVTGVFVEGPLDAR